MNVVGSHYLLELYDCPVQLLDDREFVCEALRRAVEASGATLLGEISHSFDPQGVTALGLLAESHIAIHTWPEFSYLAADIFTCGERAVPAKACDYLVRVFQAASHELRPLVRAIPARPDGVQTRAASLSPPARPSAEQTAGEGEDDPCPAPNCEPISGSANI